MFEDQRNYWQNYGTGARRTPGMKNYLGSVNTNQHPTASTAILVDTAYVNRGTGHIKPQYMLMVRPTITEPGLACDDWGIPTIPIEGYIRGHYLINATDSARGSGAGVTYESIVRTGNVDTGLDYLWNTQWERLVFTDAVHARDTLFILGGTNISNMYTVRMPDGSYRLNINSLIAESRRSGTRVRAVPLNNNLHKDVVFSMRFIERGANDFIIESETTGRIWGTKTWTGVNAGRNSTGPMIAPCEGGWVKIQNGVPIISRSDEIWNMQQGYRMNVRPVDKAPVANDEVAVAPVTVIGGDGTVAILNAAGKSVVLTNVLGQTVASAVLTSDNATLAAPKGVVVVAVEGEAAVKAVVK